MKATLNYQLKIKVWMTDGHTFEDYQWLSWKPSCEEIEKIMHDRAIKRGFKNGINDIESFEIELN